MASYPTTLVDRMVSSDVLADTAATLIVSTAAKTLLGRSKAREMLDVESEGAPIVSPGSAAGIVFPSGKEAVAAYASAVAYDVIIEPATAGWYTPDQYLMQMGMKGLAFAVSSEVAGMVVSGQRISLSPNKLLRSTLMHAFAMYVSAGLKGYGYFGGGSSKSQIDSKAFERPLGEVPI